VQTGEALLELGEWRAAVELCFARCERTSDEEACEQATPLLANHVRAVVGRCVSAAHVAMERDPRLSAPSTLRALLASLTRIQQAMKLVTDRDMGTREGLYWLTFNATVRVYGICEVCGAACVALRVLCACACCALVRIWACRRMHACVVFVQPIPRGFPLAPLCARLPAGRRKS
jgi:hypothetical protein